jgi:hypothetical protein
MGSLAKNKASPHPLQFSVLLKQLLCSEIFLPIVSCIALLWTKRSISKELAAPRAKETKYR